MENNILESWKRVLYAHLNKTRIIEERLKNWAQNPPPDKQKEYGRKTK